MITRCHACRQPTPAMTLNPDGLCWLCVRDLAPARCRTCDDTGVVQPGRDPREATSCPDCTDEEGP